MMKKKEIYGFSVRNKNGLGFTRWFNGDETITADNPEGKLPFNLNRIYINQHYLNFHPARLLTEASIEEDQNLTYVILTEQDWNVIQHPVKKLWLKLRQYIGIS